MGATTGVPVRRPRVWVLERTARSSGVVVNEVQMTTSVARYRRSRPRAQGNGYGCAVARPPRTKAPRTIGLARGQL